MTSNIAHAKQRFATRRGLLGLAAVSGVGAAFGQPAGQPAASPPGPLSSKQLAIGPIAASMAAGDLVKLNPALGQGLDAGLSINEEKEILVQLYAYAGFPRSLNALSELMKVVEDRRSRGLRDMRGAEPGPVPTGEALLELGTTNQTKLSGAPVRGPLFEFAPAIDQFLKTHLFGDIFARDNLDWRSRELATVAALASLPGVESQLLAHVRISVNVGLRTEQLEQFAGALSDQGHADAAGRVRSAIERYRRDSGKR